jgi:ketosteroid isomerase-like protein
MRQVLATFALLLPLSVAAQDAGSGTPPPVAAAAAVPDACAVWAREAGFAQSVADHDAAAFASYLHPDAVFIDGGGATRGAAAIAAAWAGIVAGKGIVLHWYPDAVDVGANGAVALSRGPYWMENPAAPPEKRYRQGRFVSTWLRGEDGQWQVVFDGGGGNVAVPATADEIANLITARRDCPGAQ